MLASGISKAHGQSISELIWLKNAFMQVKDIDIILIMSVVPGKSGQSFIYHTVDRIKEIKDLIKDKNIELRVDGGINNETAKLVDVDTVISQSYVLDGDIEERINNLR